MVPFPPQDGNMGPCVLLVAAFIGGVYEQNEKVEIWHRGYGWSRAWRQHGLSLVTLQGFGQIQQGKLTRVQS